MSQLASSARQHAAPLPLSGAMLQRKCACGKRTLDGSACGACRAVKTPLQRRGAGGAQARADVPAIVHDVLGSPGVPLDRGTRAFMEPRFGRDFSRVRVHTGAAAAASARSVDALAYTVGNAVVFGAGRFQPDSNAGKLLLAHELAHTLQQAQGPAGLAAASASLQVGAPDSSAEADAEAQARRVVDGHGVGPAPAAARSAPAGLQRQAAMSAPPSGLPCVTVSGPGHLPGTNVMFDLGSAVLSAAQHAIIGRFVTRWAGDGARDDVNVDGWASVVGAEATNWTLSCNRAETVKRDMESLGIPRVKVLTYAHGETTEFSTTDETQNQRAIITRQPALGPPPAPAPSPSPTPEPTPSPTPAPTGRAVFMCSKWLDPLGIGSSFPAKHAFFRLGTTAPGNDTVELEYGEPRPGCFQGFPMTNDPGDVAATATCVPTAITETDLMSNRSSYPIGKYCTRGPNSNTYIRAIASLCGTTGVRPDGPIPGFDDGPPPSATFAPSPFLTAVMCMESDCSLPAAPTRADQAGCVKDLGLCGIPGGIPTDDDIHRWNEECRGRTHYDGDDVTREECP